MKQFWRRFLQFPGTRENGFYVPYSDMDEVLQQYMASIPSPVCVYLSPQHLLRLVPTQPRTTVTIWREAIQAGMLPRNISFETFREALMRLSPLFFAVSLNESNKTEQDTIISWQPWVSPIWRTNVNFCKIDNNDDKNVNFKIMSRELNKSSLEVQIFDIIPKYFVPTRLVQERMRFLRDRSTCTSTVLEWHQLTSLPLASLLTWSDDHSIVKLSKDVSFNVPADNYYGLKSEPNIFHQALNVLSLLLPTFMVSENFVQSVYKEEFVKEQGVYHSVFETSFFLRFPDARALLQHPDLQFTIQRNENGGIMLHTNFLHTGRGVSNMLYELSPSARDSTMTVVSNVQQDQGEHQQNHNNSNNYYVRSVLNASLPYIPSADDEVMLQHIRGERLVGLQCAADVKNDHFSLSLATVHGDVFCFQSTISSLHRLTKSGIPYSGLPSEVHEALISAQVVKVVAIDSANVEECKLVEKSIIEIFRSCLNLNIKTICNLWKFALFTGFPLRIPPAVSLSFYRRILLLRTGVTTTTTVGSIDVGVLTPIALQVAMCAVRLCGLCGMDSSNLSIDKLHRMILNDIEETWLIRNVELRIRRYGVISPQGSSLKSLQRQLEYLSLLYGPEVCISNERTGERPLPLSTSPPSHNFNRKTDQVSSETEQNAEEKEKKDPSEEKVEEEVKEKEKEEEEEEYFSALFAETDVPSTETIKKKNEGKITEDGLLTPEEETTLQGSKNTNNDQEDKEENDNNKEEEMYNAVFATDSVTTPNVGEKKVTPGTRTILTTMDSSQKKNINTEDQNDADSKSESLSFFLAPPSTHPSRAEKLRGNHHKKNFLPPAYSITQIPLLRGPNRSVSCKTPPSRLPSFSNAEKVRKTMPNEESMMEQQHKGTVEKERDMMERLAQEIMRETQQSSALRVRNVRNGNVALSEKTMELMRELLRLNSSQK
ncbi:hypothetical protein LSM04_006433 [Trypanosoma melophagium]|uniref:uncharacterized protein n=1 Tax=Trypanosoma melophagium TaxID=715481 RepID=UPI00351A8142|nr:hypothetical protein LSM04_006433 [Trypanosoma melophagium]